MRSLNILTGLVLAGLLASVLPSSAEAVPEARHVQVDCAALRLTLNATSIRHQIKVVVTVTEEDEAALDGVSEGRLLITNPRGEQAELEPLKCETSPRRFKTATGVLLFRAWSDSAAPRSDNVPASFFDPDGKYIVQVKLRGERFTGTVSFGPGVSLVCKQAGKALSRYAMAAEEDLEIHTSPQEFGPVYFKRQDISNFIFQLANMDDALMGGDFRAPVESPMYVFQVRRGPGKDGPTAVLDPKLYIPGAQDHLIKAKQAETPVILSESLFAAGETVIVDFMRQEMLTPDTEFTSGSAHVGSRVAIQDRVVYAMMVDGEPSAKELSLNTAQRAERAARRIKSQISGR